MLPHLNFLYFQLGPVKIYTWGLFVSLGFLISLAVFVKKYPQDKNVFTDILLYVLIGAMIGARLFYVFFYAPERLAALRDFWKIWQGGMSSFGGFFGGTLAAYLYARIKKIKFLLLANKLAFVLPLGLAIARMGCYLINDHPGIKTIASPLSVAYPDGPRYDLGLLLFIFDTIIFAYFLLRRQPFNVLANFLIIYGIGRFILDFLRVGEPAYAGLLPSQYGSIVLLAIGFYLAAKKNNMGLFGKLFLKNKKTVEESRPEKEPKEEPKKKGGLNEEMVSESMGIEPEEPGAMPEIFDKAGEEESAKEEKKE